MEYIVALDPGLGLTGVEFVKAWNETGNSHGATASLYDSPKISFLPLEVTVALISAAVAVPTTVIAGFVTEYLRQKFLDKKEPRVVVTTLEAPDGRPLLVIKQATKE